MSVLGFRFLDSARGGALGLVGVGVGAAHRDVGV